MAQSRYSVGDKVLVSRDESGGNHELGEVVDSYELLIGPVRRPTIVVEFADGVRQYVTATTPNVLPVEPEEDEAAASDGGSDEGGAETDADGEAVDSAEADELDEAS